MSKNGLARLRQLAGIKEDETVQPVSEPVTEVGFFFKVNNRENMLATADALLAAGFRVDISLAMGVYQFNFQTEAASAEAQAVANTVIDTAKETQPE